MSNSYRNVTIGCPSKLTSTLYFHNASASVAMNTFNSALCSITTPAANHTGTDFYRPGSIFSTITNFVPGSAYLISARGQFTIPQQGIYETTGVWSIKRYNTYIPIDNNADVTPLSSLPAADLAKIIYVYTSILSSCDSPNPTRWRQFIPGSIFNTWEATNMQPGSAYFFYTSGDFTLTVNRANQYIVTDASNTSPTGPGYNLTANNGDRLITEQKS